MVRLDPLTPAIFCLFRLDLLCLEGPLYAYVVFSIQLLTAWPQPFLGSLTDFFFPPDSPRLPGSARLRARCLARRLFLLIPGPTPHGPPSHQI